MYHQDRFVDARPNILSRNFTVSIVLATAPDIGLCVVAIKQLGAVATSFHIDHGSPWVSWYILRDVVHLAMDDNPAVRRAGCALLPPLQFTTRLSAWMPLLCAKLGSCSASLSWSCMVAGTKTSINVTKACSC